VLEKCHLPSHGSGIHLDKIDHDTGTRDSIPFDFLTSGSKALGLVVKPPANLRQYKICIIPRK